MEVLSIFCRLNHFFNHFSVDYVSNPEKRANNLFKNIANFIKLPPNLEKVSGNGNGFVITVGSRALRNMADACS